MENRIVIVVKGIILYNNKVLIIKRDKNDEVGAGTWEFAGGKIEFGEELEDALLREVKEETGIDITIEKILYATTFKTDQTRQVVLAAYICHAINNTVILSEEHNDYMWVSKEELRQFLDVNILYDMDKYGAFKGFFL